MMPLSNSPASHLMARRYHICPLNVATGILMSPESIPFESTLRTELYTMNSNGTEKVQITNINEEGLPGTEWDQYLQGGQLITGNTWSSDGKKIFFGMLFFAKNGNLLGIAVWQLTFKDACEKIAFRE